MDDYLRQMMEAKARRAQLADQMAEYNFNRQIERDRGIQSNLSKLQSVANQASLSKDTLPTMELAYARNQALTNLLYLTGQQHPWLGSSSGGQIKGTVGSESDLPPLEKGWSWR